MATSSKSGFMPPIEYHYPRSQPTHTAKTFAIYFTKMERTLSDATSGLGKGIYKDSLARGIVFAELDKLIQNVVKPIYMQWAPQGPTLSGSGYQQHAANQRLKKSIQKWTLKSAMQVGLRMNFYGNITMEGRNALPNRPYPSKPYPIITPEGILIFRRKVGPATTSGGMMGNGMEGSGSERMEWALRAAQEIERGKYLDETAKNIAYRIWYESGLFGITQGRDGRLMLEETHRTFTDEHGVSHPTHTALHSHAMRKLGLRPYKTVQRGGQKRGRPSKYTAEQKRAIARKVKAKARERQKEAAKKARVNKRRAADYKKNWDKHMKDPDFLKKHGVKGDESDKSAIASLKKRLTRSATNPERKVTRQAAKTKGTKIKNAAEHANHLLEDYNSKRARLEQMREHGTYTPQNLAKQEARVQRSERALHDFLQKHK